MHEVVIVVTGEPIAAAHARRGGFPRLVSDAIARPDVAFAELDPRAAPLPPLERYAAVIITGSAASVTERAPWMLATEARLREAAESGTAVLGICFGHQLLGQALGGEVAQNPRGREIGTLELQLVAPDPLFDPAERPVLVNMTHLDSIVRLPPGAAVLGRTALDPNAAVRFTESVWGVQFHPELDAGVMADYVEGRRALLEAEGLDATAIRRSLGDATAGRDVLRRFVSAALR